MKKLIPIFFAAGIAKTVNICYNFKEQLCVENTYKIVVAERRIP